jgi:O-antigen/teichoic acid export membrane protein
VWRPVWRPRLAWSLPTMRYFIHFGSRQFVVNTLSFALDQVDDLWTGFFLGKLPLGFYARAYAFATYPRQVFAIPVNAVTAGTYAELKGDRSLLSKAFFRTSALLVYSGFFLGGLLTLVAPEMIRLLLGAKWLPMLDAFRLMLVFTLLDPLRGTIVNLFVAVGEPEQVGRVQIAQLGILIAGLFVLGLWLGITGVALAVDAMLAAGILLLLWRARAHVDFSLRRLFTMPGLALVSGLVLARSVIVLPGVLGSDWRTGLLKAVTFSTVYSITLLVTERHELQESVFPTVVYILRAFKGRMTLDT